MQYLGSCSLLFAVLGFAIRTDLAATILASLLLLFRLRLVIVIIIIWVVTEIIIVIDETIELRAESEIELK